MCVEWLLNVRYCGKYCECRHLQHATFSLKKVLYFTEILKILPLKRLLLLLFFLKWSNQMLNNCINHFWLRVSPAAAAAKSLQSCPTLCDPIDGSPPGFPVPGILQARTLEWVAISFCYAWKWKVKVKSLSRVRLLETPCTAAHQVLPSMGFSRQECWSGVPLLSPINRASKL